MNGIIEMIYAIVLVSSNPNAPVTEDFQALGFGVEPIAENTFMLSAQDSVFTQVFDKKIHHSEDGEVWVLDANERSYRLPIDRLPSNIQSYVEAVEFQRLIEFGPTDF